MARFTFHKVSYHVIAQEMCIIADRAVTVLVTHLANTQSKDYCLSETSTLIREAPIYTDILQLLYQPQDAKSVIIYGETAADHELSQNDTGRCGSQLATAAHGLGGYST